MGDNVGTLTVRKNCKEKKGHVTPSRAGLCTRPVRVSRGFTSLKVK